MGSNSADVKKWIKELLLAETGEYTIANHEIMNLAEEYQLDAKQISEIYEALHEMDIGITFDEDAVSEDGSTLIPKKLEEEVENSDEESDEPEVSRIIRKVTRVPFPTSRTIRFSFSISSSVFLTVIRLTS